MVYGDYAHQLITCHGGASPSYGGKGGRLFWAPRHTKGPISSRTDGQTDPMYGLELSQDTEGVLLAFQALLTPKQVRDRTQPPPKQ